MTWDQWLILLCGVTAVFLSMAGRESRRRWAPVLGLLGQPGWFVAALPAHQLGVLLVAVLYTLAWCRGPLPYSRPSATVAARQALRWRPLRGPSARPQPHAP